jgi:DNA-binding response OmpR family regulator
MGMSKTILVVDDDQSIMEVIQMVLEGEGYQVETSLDEDCFPLPEDNLPDLILLDLLLLGRDGREICQHLKSNQATAHIPVIMLSAHSDADRVANMSGADDFLEKPFDVDALINIVEKHLASTHISDQLLREETLG